MGYILMYCVVFGGYDECLKIMFSWLDGDLNVVDLNDGWMLVYFVVWKGYGKCFKLLLWKGGDLFLGDYKGNILILLVLELCLIVMIYYFVGEFNLVFEKV